MSATMALRVAELVALFVVCTFGAGLSLARRLRVPPVETLTAALGISFFVLYATSFAITLWKLPPAAYFAVTAVCALSSSSAFRDSRAILSDREVRRAFGGFVLVVSWGLLLTALIRNFTGGGWAGDWLEHYQRALFFLDQAPFDTRFLGVYWLPARPPLMNLVGAHFLAHVGRDFALYQILVVVLNATVFFPLYLLARLFSRDGDRPLAPLVAFVVLNPMFAHNLTYGWTRHLTSFYVLSGIYAYATARTSRQPVRYALAFFALTAGALTHYSAAPYLVFLALHFVVVVLPGKTIRHAPAAATSVLCVLALWSWIGWSLQTYGREITFGSNTTITESQGLSAKRYTAKFLYNLRNTLVPHPLRNVNPFWLEQGDPCGYAKDWWFLIYQTNLLFALGSAGALLLFYESLLRHGATPWAQFWTPMTLTTLGIGIAVNNNWDDFGVAHVCLQPLVLMALALLAARFPSWPRTLRWLSLGGLLADLALGIGLLLRFEHLVPIPGLEAAAGVQRWSPATYLNWRAKQDAGLTFLGDLMEPETTLVVLAIAVLLFALLIQARASRQLAVPRDAET